MAVRSLTANTPESPYDWMTNEEQSRLQKSTQNDPQQVTVVIQDPTDTAALYWENVKVFNGGLTTANGVPFPAGGLVLTESKLSEIEIVSDINIDVRYSFVG